MKETDPEFRERDSFPSTESATKVATLRLFRGAWNAILPRESWAQVFSSDPNDCPGPVESRTQSRRGAGAGTQRRL